jgi:transposase-like protein
VKLTARPRPWSPPRSAFAGFRFPAEVIVVAVRWYLRYNLSYRDVAELLVERGIEVDHVTVFRWVQRFTPLLADAARLRRHSPGDRWFVDETYVKVNGVWRYVYRAIDQHGQVIDVLASARRFFRRTLSVLQVTPSEVVTDAAAVYPAVLDELIPSAWHHVERYANNPIEADQASSQGESHPPALSEPCVNLSIYTAPITRSCGRTPNCQWANNFGYRLAITRSRSHARPGRRRSRLNFWVAHRIR